MTIQEKEKKVLEICNDCSSKMDDTFTCPIKINTRFRNRTLGRVKSVA